MKLNADKYEFGHLISLLANLILFTIGGFYCQVCQAPTTDLFLILDGTTATVGVGNDKNEWKEPTQKETPKFMRTYHFIMLFFFALRSFSKKKTGSRCAGSLNFAIAKQFLSHFVDHFAIGYTLSRVAFCQFTPMLRPEFYFGNYFDSNSIKRSIVYANYVPCVNEMTCSGQIAVNKSLPKALSLGLSNSTGDRSDVPDVVIIVANSANKPSSRDIIHVNRALTGPVYIILILVGDTGDTAWVGNGVTTVKIDRYDRLLDDLSDSLCQYLSDFVNRANGRPGVIRTPPSIVDLTRGRNLTVTLTTSVSVDSRGTTSEGVGATAVSITDSGPVATTNNGHQVAGTTKDIDGNHGGTTASGEAGSTGSGTGVAESSTVAVGSGPKTTKKNGNGGAEGEGKPSAGGNISHGTTNSDSTGGGPGGSGGGSHGEGGGSDGGHSNNGSDNAGAGTAIKGGEPSGGTSQHTGTSGGSNGTQNGTAIILKEADVFTSTLMPILIVLFALALLFLVILCAVLYRKNQREKEIERQMLTIQNDVAAATQSSKRPQIYRDQLTETDSILGFAAKTTDVSLAVPPAKEQFRTIENSNLQKTGQHAHPDDHQQWSRQNSEWTLSDHPGGHAAKLAKTRTYADYDIVNVETGSHHDLQTADAMPPGSFVKNRRTGSTHDVGSLLEAFGFEDTDPVWQDITKNYSSVNAMNGQESEFKSIPVYPDGIYAKNKHTGSTHDVRALHNRLLASQAQKEHNQRNHSAAINSSIAVDGTVKGLGAAPSHPARSPITRSSEHHVQGTAGGYTSRKSTHMNKAIGDDRSFNANLRRDRGTMTPGVQDQRHIGDSESMNHIEDPTTRKRGWVKLRRRQKMKYYSVLSEVRLNDEERNADRNVDTPLNDIGTDTTNRTHGGRNSHEENTVDDGHTLDDSGSLDPRQRLSHEETETGNNNRSKVIRKKRNKVGHHFDPENKGKALLNYRFGNQGMDLTVYYPNFHGTDMAAYNVKTVDGKLGESASILYSIDEKTEPSTSANSIQQTMHHASYLSHEQANLDDNTQISLVNKGEHGLPSSNVEHEHASLEHGVMTDNGAEHSNKNDTEAQVNLVIGKADLPLMDLLFLVDNSSSMTVRSFEKAKKFMKNLVHNVDVGLKKSRVGLVVFSQEPSLIFGMDKYLSSEFVKNAIGRIYYQGGGSFIGKALDFAYKIFRGLRNPVSFVPKSRHHKLQTADIDSSNVDLSNHHASNHQIKNDHQDRRLQVLILITDGNSGDPVELAAEKLRRADVQIAAIGVKRHQREALSLVTRDVDRLFMLDQTYDVVRWLESLKFRKKRESDDDVNPTVENLGDS